MAPFWVDEHPFATYFDVHLGYRVLTHSQFAAVFALPSKKSLCVRTLSLPLLQAAIVPAEARVATVQRTHAEVPQPELPVADHA